MFHNPTIAAMTGFLLLNATSVSIRPASAEAAATGGTDAQTPALEKVVLHADKPRRLAKDVPASVTVVGGNALGKGGHRTLSELQAFLPNVSFDRAGTANVSIRGVGGGGRNIGFETRTGVFVDGIYVGQAQALMMPLLDIAQLEVLRGPQGYLFGRNTVSGAINLVTAEPESVFSSRLSGRLGTDDAREFAGHVTGPLTEMIDGRFAASYENRGGYTHNRFDGLDLDGFERFGSRGQLKFTTDDDWTIALHGDYFRSSESFVVGEPVSGFFDHTASFQPLPPGSVDINTPPLNKIDLGGISLDVRVPMAGGRSLVSTSGYRTSRQRRQSDTDYRREDLLHTNFNDSIAQVSQEFRLESSQHERTRYVAGLYLLNESADSDRRATVGQDLATVVPLPVGSPVPFAPFGRAFGLTPGSVVSAEAAVESRERAAFASVDVQLTDRLSFNVGGRYTRESKRVHFDLDGSRSGAFRIATLRGFRDVRSDGNLSGTAAIGFAATPNANVYLRMATASKSGGWNLDFLNSAQVATGFDFDAERVRSVELGVKGAGGKRLINYELSAFRNRFNDFQVFQFVALGGGASILQLRNAAQVEATGAEVNLIIQATHALRLGANLGYVNAVFRSFPNGGPGGRSLSGNKLPAPRFNAALAVDYQRDLAGFDGRVDWHADIGYRAAYFATPSNDPVRDLIDSRTLANARLGYTDSNGRFGVGLWARNVFDAEYYNTRGRDFLGNRFVQRAEPRSYGVDIWTSF